MTKRIYRAHDRIGLKKVQEGEVMNDAFQNFVIKFNQAQSPKEKVEVLDELLSQFPLLHGYWLKKIDLSDDKPSEWKNALQRCPVLDLWTKFLDSSYGTSLEDAHAAVKKFGFHYQSHPVWQKLIERSGFDHSLILQVIQKPLYAYAQFFQIAYEQKAASSDQLEKLSNEISAEVGRRWQFEANLARPYFHPQPIEDLELKTWNEYLTYIESKSCSNEEVVQLYERCLVTTALNPGIWIRYICWSVEHETDTAELYEAASRYHSHNLTIKALYSRFLELRGDVEKARAKLVGNKASLLTNFDFRNELVPDSNDSKYMVKRGNQSFRILADSSGDANDGNADPKALIDQWRQGTISDSEQYACTLKKFGHLDLYFEVDATLGYNEF